MLWGDNACFYLIRYQLLCPTNILSFSSFSSKCWLWLCESAGRITRGCAQSLRHASAETVNWMLFNGSLHGEQSYNPTSSAGTSINYVQSSFYIQACSCIYIRNYWAVENEFCRDFFPFLGDIIISGCKMRLYKIFH